MLSINVLFNSRDCLPSLGSHVSHKQLAICDQLPKTSPNRSRVISMESHNSETWGIRLPST